MVAFALALAPALRDSAREQDAAVQRARAELARRLEVEQRPHHARSRSVASGSAGERLAARAALLDDVVGTIEADARARVRRGDLEGRVRRVECEPFPRTVGSTGPERDLTRRRGRYACLAVSSEFSGGVIGHQYRVLVDFETGRYAYCKISGQSGPSRDQLVTTPRACGG